MIHKYDGFGCMMAFFLINVYWMMFCGLCLITNVGIHYLLNDLPKDWLIVIIFTPALLSSWVMFLYPIFIGCQELYQYWKDRNSENKTD